MTRNYRAARCKKGRNPRVSCGHEST